MLGWTAESLKSSGCQIPARISCEVQALGPKAQTTYTLVEGLDGRSLGSLTGAELELGRWGTAVVVLRATQ